MANILLINGSPSAPSRSQGLLDYAIDKQIIVNDDRTVTLEEEIDQRLKQSIEELLTAIKKK